MKFLYLEIFLIKFQFRLELCFMYTYSATLLKIEFNIESENIIHASYWYDLSKILLMGSPRNWLFLPDPNAICLYDSCKTLSVVDMNDVYTFLFRLSIDMLKSLPRVNKIIWSWTFDVIYEASSDQKCYLHTYS